MALYKAPIEDVLFLLSDVFQIGRYNNLPGFSDASADLRRAVLEEAARFASKCSRRSTLWATSRAALATPTAAWPPPKDLCRPSGNMPTAAGWAFPRPWNSAAKACRKS